MHTSRHPGQGTVTAAGVALRLTRPAIRDPVFTAWRGARLNWIPASAGMTMLRRGYHVRHPGPFGRSTLDVFLSVTPGFSPGVHSIGGSPTGQATAWITGTSLYPRKRVSG